MLLFFNPRLWLLKEIDMRHIPAVMHRHVHAKLSGHHVDTDGARDRQKKTAPEGAVGKDSPSGRAYPGAAGIKRSLEVVV